MSPATILIALAIWGGVLGGKAAVRGVKKLDHKITAKIHHSPRQ